ncbi:MAG: hypothetical protein QOG62_2195 [Thermoleophilaceae bacterium]|nr:hypothetical protein [Thermoleophilaceae bacterium]
MKTWHAAIASFGTAAFLVAAYVAVLSVSGALFALTDLSHVGDAVVVPKLKTVVATKPIKVAPVVARAPRPTPPPKPAPAPKPQVVASTSLVQELPATPSHFSSSPSKPAGKPSFQDPTGRSQGGGADGGGRTTAEEEEASHDDAALLSGQGVNASGPARNAADKVNTALDSTVGGNLKAVTDPAVKAVDFIERQLGLDRQK